MASRRRTGRSILVVVLMVALYGCGGSGPTAPSLTPLVLVAETADIAFYAVPDDYIDTQWQQQVHDWLESTLGVTLSSRLKYHKYASKAAMTAHTGSGGNAWADPDPTNPAIHTIWSRDMHETVHVLSARIGRPSDFFNEGLAVAHSGMDPMAGDLVPKWHATPIHAVARGFRQGEGIPPLADWVESKSFRGLPDSLTYPCSGSFVRYLIDTHGLAAMLSLFPGASREADLATIQERFRAAMGVSLAVAEADWHRFLDR